MAIVLRIASKGSVSGRRHSVPPRHLSPSFRVPLILSTVGEECSSHLQPSAPADFFERTTADRCRASVLDPHSRKLSVFGVECYCLGLDRLIQAKRDAGRPKDLEAIAELEALREE